MTQPWFPDSPDELTSEWLTSALRDCGAIGEACVTNFSVEQVGQGVGFVGHLARIGLEYDRGVSDAPASVVGKFPSQLEGARQIATLFGLYEREALFYRDLAAHVGIGAPKCYFSGCDNEKGRYLVLLEDLCDGRFGDQVLGCTLDEGRSIIQQLAKFHARWWDSPDLAAVAWIPLAVDLVGASVSQAYGPTWPMFVERFGDRLSPELRERGPHLGEDVVALLDKFAGRTLTLTHSDFRVDNLFFPRAGSGRDLVVVDWQAPLRSPFPAYDAIYLIVGGLEPAVRRAHEEELLRLYHDTLLAEGVKGFSFDQLREDCRASLLYVFAIICVIAGGTLDMVNDRAVELFETMFTRFLPAIEDHNALAVLD